MNIGHLGHTKMPVQVLYSSPNLVCVLLYVVVKAQMEKKHLRTLYVYVCIFAQIDVYIYKQC